MTDTPTKEFLVTRLEILRLEGVLEATVEVEAAEMARTLGWQGKKRDQVKFVDHERARVEVHEVP